MNYWFIFFLCAHTVYAWDYNPINLIRKHKAVMAYQGEDFAKAEQLFEHVVATCPNDWQAVYNAGKAAYKQEKFEKAASFFNDAADICDIQQEKKIQALYDKGNARVQLKQWQEALDAYKAVLALDEKHVYAQKMVDYIEKLLEEKKRQEEQERQQQQEKKEQEEQQESNQQQNQSQQEQKKDQDQNAESQEQQEGSEKPGSHKESDKQQQKQQNGEAAEQEEEHENKDNLTDKEQQRTKPGSAENGNESEHDQPQKRNSQQSVGDEHDDHQESNEVSSHNTPSGNDDTTNTVPNSDEKKQVLQAQEGEVDDIQNDQRLDEKEKILLKLLDEKDVNASKSFLKKTVNREMPKYHGQKNW